MAAPAEPALDALAELRFGRFTLQPAARLLLVDGEPAKLGARAFDVLTALIKRRERTVSKDELLETVWPGLVVEENNLQVHISSLRKLIGPQAIATIPGRGYRFSVALDSPPASTSAAPLLQAQGLAATSAHQAESAGACANGNLPDPLPPLYGREQALHALIEQVRSQRLVTLVGAGGIGKTRLAQAAAHALRRTFDGGSWMVELASVVEPGLLPAAVAQALGLALPGRKAPGDEVVEALRGLELLLVLDNCEHLIEAAGALAVAILDHAPQTRLLVTSQEQLHVPGEQLYLVPPLTLPDSPAALDAGNSGAVELLVQRVRALQSGFALRDDNRADVVAICSRLDGLPLAIELAAARVPLLGASGVRERLHERFRMLTGGARTGLRRHQTLRETLAWSHALLSAQEGAAFRRAGVFAGGFDMAAAQHVLADADFDEWAVLDSLGGLVDKSLVVAEPGEPPRYRLLESTRAYALERLRDAGETEATLARHAQAMHRAFDAGLRLRWSASRATRLNRYGADLDNLRAAIDWAAAGDADTHIALVAASAWVWELAGQRLEGLRRGASALARVGPGTPAAAEALLQSEWAGIALKEPGPAPRAAAKRAVALQRALGDPGELYLALGRLAIAAALANDNAAAELALAEMTEQIDPGWPALARWDALLARSYVVFLACRFNEGPSIVEDMLRLADSVGDTYKRRFPLMCMEQLAQIRGDFAEAVKRGRELIALARLDRFDGSWLSTCIGNLATALIRQGALDEALVTVREAAALHAQTGTLWQLLDPLALLCCKRGRHPDAARILGRAEAVNRWRGGLREQAEQLTRDEAWRLLQQALSGEDLARFMQLGEALADEEAARLGLMD